MRRALRVLRVEPASPLSGEQLRRVCERARGLGFEQLSLAEEGEPIDADGVRTRRDLIAGLAAECRSHGLDLLIDAEPATAPRDGTLAARHPQWFDVSPRDDLPDPRWPARDAHTVPLRGGDAHVRAQAAAWWAERMVEGLEAGAAGFHCLRTEALAADFWRTLNQAVRAGHPDACLIAAPGGEASSLRDCGFDAIASPVPGSAAEVERRIDEHDRIAEHSAPLAVLSRGRRHPVCASTAVEPTEQAHRRGLWWAASTGAGWMMPLGFERGVPGDQALLADGAEFDLSADVAAANAWLGERSERRANGAGRTGGAAEAKAAGRAGDRAANARTGMSTGARSAPRLSLLSAAGSPAVALLVAEPRESNSADGALLLLAGFPGATAVRGADVLPGADRFTRFRRVQRGNGARAGFADAARSEPEAATDAAGRGEQGFDAAATIELPPGSVALYESLRDEPAAARPTRAAATANRARRALDLALEAPRIAIEGITPSVDGGRFPVKRIAGETLRVEADVFMDGHEQLAVMLLWRGPDEADWRELPMSPLGNDRWRAEIALSRLGRHAFTIEAWRDAYETFADELRKKLAAGLDVSLEIEEGRLLIVQAAAHATERKDAATAAALQAIVATLGEPMAGKRKTRAPTEPPPDPAPRTEILLAAATRRAVHDAGLRPFALRHEPALCVDAERTAARHASWYELFPRSIGNRPGEPLRHGRFIDVIERLPAIRAMGFDVLYFPPIHPIGLTNRKGRNNTLTPTPDDPGSPYAIGSEEGGHDAIHRELGTLEDFVRLVQAASVHGLEVALDFAIQCSPDHPWLKDHPEWFSWRPDGSMRYAENPPKKYQDIVNVDFYAEGARPALWTALRDVVMFWVKQGVRLFRVDNPHTKPLPFWEWLIADVRGRHPDVIFLSEAFTRPKPMARLAKVGFSQSYTYFTWRHTKQEFTDYLTELNQPPLADVLRPHFFVNTPDINPPFLQRSGRAGFLIRAALATTLSGLWGMYSGFELCEGTPLPGKEEYLDSEKFELRAWDWDRPGHIKAEIALLNRIRRGNPALQSHLGIEFFNATSEHILYFAKAPPAQVARSGGRFGEHVLLVAINLDPFNAHEADIELPLWRFGLPDDAALEAVDLLHDHRFVWRGKHQRIRLDPAQWPLGIWRVKPLEGA